MLTNSPKGESLITDEIEIAKSFSITALLFLLQFLSLFFRCFQKSFIKIGQ